MCHDAAQATTQKTEICIKLATKSPKQLVRVALPQHVPTLLDYAVSAETPVKVGDFLSCPLMRRKCHGVVVELLEASPYKAIKTAEILPDVPPLALPTVEFFRWAARYSMSMPGAPVRAALPGGKVPAAPAALRRLVRGEETPKRLTPQRQRVMDIVAQKAWSVADLCSTAQVTPSVVQGLVKAGALVWQECAEHVVLPQVGQGPRLTAEQAAAVQKITSSFHNFQQDKSAKAQPVLLDGITGSGKTEVYFSSLDALWQQQPDGQVLLLVPEIALTPQLIQRVSDRFGVTPHVWHARQTPAAKQKTWWAVHRGEARVIVGARSALFLPFHNLRLVVVDEEHDPSYKQDEGGFHYHGRDLAVVLAKLWGAGVILGSATPSLESWHNTQQGKYVHVAMRERIGQAVLPDIYTLDLKGPDKTATDHFLAPTMLAALEKTLEKREQALLFLNRRGFAPLLICRKCGHRHDCPNCSASLVVHGDRLTCHHCGYSDGRPEVCGECGAEDALHPFGPGTRKVVQEVRAALPFARVAVADSDALTTPKQFQELMVGMAKGQIDILVGTQLVAKGHHFPKLTMVGVIDADMGLAMGDLRAAERTFQLLTQVAGRAGRAEHPGSVWLQTFQPEHPLFGALVQHDRDAYYKLELTARQQWGDPPFGRLVSLMLRGLDEQQTRDAALRLAQAFPVDEGVSLLGPAPPLVAKLRNQYRFRLLVKGTSGLQTFVQNWVKTVPLPKGVELFIDVDPQRLA